MKRKTGMLGWGLALMAVSAPGVVLSMGLGDIKVQTALNQPLRARIGLLSVEPGEIEDIRVALASLEVFERVGLERPFVLSQLKFEPRVIDGGGTVIEVTTKQAVREPFLNFLVEVQWPQGRLLREYTVLLDPPVLMEERGDIVTEAPVVAPRTHDAAASTAPVGSVDSPVESPRPTSRPDSVSARQSTNAAAPKPASTAGEPTQAPVSYEVQTGDTLGEIAEQYRAEDVGLSRMMIAILRANPYAFIEGNINNLMTGVILRMPARKETAAIGDEAAIAEVARQHSLWEEHRAQVAGALPTAQVDNTVSAAPSMEPAPGEAGLEAPQVEGAPQEAATSELTGESAGVEFEPETRLKIMVSEQDQSTALSARAHSDPAAEPQPDAALAQEMAASRRIEIDALQTRVGELESMIAKQARIISLQSEALAQLQARLRDNPEAADTAMPDTAAEEIGDVAAQQQAAVTAGAATAADTSSTQQTATAESPSAQAEGQGSQGANTMEAAAENAQMATATEGVTAKDAEARAPAEATAGASAPDEANGEIVGATREDSPAEIAKAAITDAGATSPALSTSRDTNQADRRAQPVQPEAPASSPSPGLIEAVLASPAMLIGAGVGAAVLLAMIWIVGSRAAARRARSIDLTTYQEDKATIGDGGLQSGSLAAATVSQAQAASAAAVVPIASNVAASEIGAAAALNARAAEPQGSASQDALINDDKMAEADVYIAYGLHQQAEDLLGEALAQDPGRNEYRLKLLEVHYATKNIAAFETQAQTLADNLGGGPDPLWDRAVAMGRDMNPLNPLFDGSNAGPAAQARSQSDAPEPNARDVQSNQAAYEQPANARPGGAEPDALSSDEALELDLAAGGQMQDAHGEDLAGAPAASDRSNVLEFDIDDLEETVSAEGSSEPSRSPSRSEEAALEFDLSDLEIHDQPGAPLDSERASPTFASHDPDNRNADFSAQKQPFGAREPAEVDGEQSVAAGELESLIEIDDERTAVADEAVLGLDDGALEALSDGDEVGTKLDLAKAYLDMGDSDGALSTLEEVLQEGDDAQRKEAEQLMRRIA